MDMDFKFMSDDEVKQMLESILDGVQEEVAADEDETTILDPLKLMQIKFVYSVLKYLTRGTDAEVSYKLYQPFKSMGSVSVEAKALEFDDPEWFARAAEFASKSRRRVRGHAAPGLSKRIKRTRPVGPQIEFPCRAGRGRDYLS